jgi:hypothetical protein
VRIGLGEKLAPGIARDLQTMTSTFESAMFAKKKGLEKREAALAEPPLLPGVCP